MRSKLRKNWITMLRKLAIALLMLNSCTQKVPVQEVEGEEPQVITDSLNQLEDKIQVLELKSIGNTGPIWITSGTLSKYEGKGAKPNEILEHCIYIEPADPSLIVPESFDRKQQKIVVEGQFYVHEDYPQGTIRTEENEKKAKVFRYNKMEIVEDADPGRGFN